MVYSSDVIVFKEFSYLPRSFRLDVSKLKDKIIIVLFGGVGFRNKARFGKSIRVYTSINRNVKWATSSLDFLDQTQILLSWIPPCTRTDELRSMYDFSKRDPPLMAASPSLGTNKLCHVKPHFDSIVSQLKGKHAFQTDFIFNVVHHECLTRKAHASIFFDRIFDIYGINSHEAATFEAAIVTGVSRSVLDRLDNEGFNCPFVVAENIHEATKAIADLLSDMNHLKEKALECYRYVEQLHSGKESAKRLVRLIEQ